MAEDKVNIEKIVSEKGGAKAKWIPKFLLKLVAKLIHQNDINEILNLFDYQKDIKFIELVLNHLKITREVVGIENLSPDGRYIIASNHPLGGVDGFVLSEIISNKMGSVKVVVNDILMAIYPVKGIFLPINKHGRQNSDYARNLNQSLESNEPIIYFPAGLCSRKVDGKITDLKWNNSFVKKALEHKRDIVPVWFDSVNSTFFYNFALWRKKLGIKANLEMALLPGELFRKRGKSVRVIIGTPISYETLKNSTIKECVESIRECSSALQSRNVLKEEL